MPALISDERQIFIENQNTAGFIEDLCSHRLQPDEPLLESSRVSYVDFICQ